MGDHRAASISTSRWVLQDEPVQDLVFACLERHLSRVLETSTGPQVIAKQLGNDAKQRELGVTKGQTVIESPWHQLGLLDKHFMNITVSLQIAYLHL